MFSALLSLASSKRRFHRRHHRPLLNSDASDGYFMVDKINVSYSNCVNVVISRPSDILTKAPQLIFINNKLQTDLMIQAEDYFADSSSIGDKYSKWDRSNQQTKSVLKNPNNQPFAMVDPMLMAAFYKDLYYIDGWYAELIPEGKKLTIRAFSVQVSTDQANQKGNLNTVLNELFYACNNPSTQEEKQIYNKIFHI